MTPPQQSMVESATRFTPPARENLSVRSTVAPWLTLNLHAVLPQVPGSRAILLLHGATLSSFIFDLPVAGYSMQARLAESGWATYALDARGFGLSSRPQPGEPGCADDRPFGRAEEGIADIADAVRYLRTVRKHSEVALIGFSWGTILAGWFAARHPDAVERLVLCAPIHACANAEWLQRLRDPDDPALLNRALGAYRWTSAESLHARWDGDIGVADKQAWRDAEVLNAVLQGALATDPMATTRVPPAFRAPSGPVQDLFQAFTGHALFDPSRIHVPTLLLRGEGDTTATDADARLLMRRLGSHEKLYRVIPAGSHFQCLERSMPQVFATCSEFLRGGHRSSEVQPSSH